jgi:prepilin-type N-terminal cleavage/methylation domain-containing protein
MKRFIKKILNQSAAGFSLMEMVVVLAVFSMTALMAVDLFVTITNVQRQVRNVQSVQSDARFVMESLVREAQVGTIDYEFYGGHCLGGSDEDADNYNKCEDNSECGGGVCQVIDLSADPTDILATKDQENKQIFYRKNGDELEVCSNSSFYRNRCSQSGNWQVVTPEKVKITLMSFYISPFSDPYSVEMISCTLANQAIVCPSKVCNDPGDNLCVPPDTQPLVTIIMESEAGEGAEQEKVNLQTTVTSMLYRR